MRGAYYNEHDPKAAAWLRALIAAGHIAAGDVDERSIEDVAPGDLAGYAQCHFFAGIGGWSYALRIAGWPDERPVWTGSCPCQPFSTAGKGVGFADERHLWPAWHWLINECRPPILFGEQVASKDGLVWFDLVSADLEGSGYSVGAADLCAASVGAPHIRQRLWFVGHHHHQGLEGWSKRWDGRDQLIVGAPSVDGRMEHDASDRRQQRRPEPSERSITSGRSESVMADDDDERFHRRRAFGQGGRCEPADGSELGDAESANGQVPIREWRSRQEGSQFRGPSRPWHLAQWLPCTDGKSRPIEPGTFPLAHGVPNRVGLLRGYGNAIVPQVAAAFIGACR